MCDYCEKEKPKIVEYFDGDAIPMRSSFTMLFKDEASSDCYARIVNNKLYLNNSDGEYPDGIVTIEYCPWCGAKLKEEE